MEYSPAIDRRYFGFTPGGVPATAGNGDWSWRKNEIKVRVQGVTRRDAVALIGRYVKAGVFHAQWLKYPSLEEGVELLTSDASKDRALHLLLKAVAEFGTGLRFERQLGQFGNDVVVRAAPKIGLGVHLIDFRIGAAERRTESEACRRRHEMAHGHGAVKRHELAILQHLQIRELGDELRDGIVELPLALFIKEKHRNGDNWFGHRGDAVDGVFAQRLATFKGLEAIKARLHELAVAGHHDTDPGIMTSINLGLHGGINAVEALGGQTHRGWGSDRQRSCQLGIDFDPIFVRHKIYSFSVVDICQFRMGCKNITYSFP